MYIETRFYDDGTAKAKFHQGNGYPALEGDTTKCDCYLESIRPQDDSGDNDYDYESLEEWIDEMCIELDDVVPLVIAMVSGKWFDITKYC